ncbi:PRC-barrel domain containing protein [Halorubrum sp. 2020YC2]|uniref:PRC-barrel domain containing protein n=1 Tax=Halorubrum sp. 2020YC2 TaxID=2836432 RepID=UPI001BEB0D8C|nr:PRC-barrel domain containing protein [Halorubrum sp. 2020YC2]QWC20209.1 PRC-barrel domain containing protein [Halorubrum sp. 2020YC2]
MERDYITDDDEGKAVVDSNGEQIGMIAEVRSGTAYVDADPSLADTVLSKLGWSDADGDDYPLQENRIHTVTDDEVRLNEEF